MAAKRQRDDNELQAAVAPLNAFTLGQMPRDLVWTLVFKTGLSVRDMHRLCSINKRFRSICMDEHMWTHLFVEKVIAKKMLEDTDAARAPYIADGRFSDWVAGRSIMPNPIIRTIAYTYAFSARVSFDAVIAQKGAYQFVILSRDGNFVQVRDATAGKWVMVRTMRGLPLEILNLVRKSGGQENNDLDDPNNKGPYIPQQNLPFFIYNLLEDDWKLPNPRFDLFLGKREREDDGDDAPDAFAPFDTMPKDVLSVVLARLPLRDIMHMYTVNKKFLSTMRNYDSLWDEVFAKRTTSGMEAWNNSKAKMPLQLPRLLAFLYVQAGSMAFKKRFDNMTIEVTAYPSAQDLRFYALCATYESDDGELGFVDDMFVYGLGATLSQLDARKLEADVMVIDPEALYFYSYLMIVNKWAPSGINNWNALLSSRQDFAEREMHGYKLPLVEGLVENGGSTMDGGLLKCEMCSSAASALVCSKCESLAFCGQSCMDAFFAVSSNAIEHEAVCASSAAVELIGPKAGGGRRRKSAGPKKKRGTSPAAHHQHQRQSTPKPAAAARAAKTKKKRGTSPEAHRQHQSQSTPKASPPRIPARPAQHRERSKSKSPPAVPARPAQHRERSKSKSPPAAAAKKAPVQKQKAPVKKPSQTPARPAQSREQSKEKSPQDAAAKKAPVKKPSQTPERRSKSKSPPAKPARPAQPRESSKKKKSPPSTAAKKAPVQKQKEQRGRSNSKEKPTEKSEEKEQRGRSKGASSSRPLFNNRTKRTDNRSYRGPTFNFGGRGNTNLPSVPTPYVPTPSVPNFGGGSGGGGSPTVIVVPQSVPAPAPAPMPAPTPSQPKQDPEEEGDDSESEITKGQ